MPGRCNLNRQTRKSFYYLGLGALTSRALKISPSTNGFPLCVLFWHLLLGITAVAPAADLGEAAALLRAGKHDECVQVTAAAIDEGQYSETWRTLKIQAELASGRNAEALATFEAALERYKTSVRIRWLGYQVCRLNGLAEKATELLDQIDELMDGGSWRYTDPASRVALGEFYLRRGVDAKQVMSVLYNQVKKRNPDYSRAYIASGQLALSKHDYALAAEEFEKALKLDTTDADIHFGLAAAFASSDGEKSQQHLTTALERNRNHIDSLLFIADRHIDSEDYDKAREALEQALQVNILEPRAWAYLAVLAHLDNDMDGEEHCRQTALSWWSDNPEVPHLIGRKLAEKYRFAEGASYQREALQFDEDYLPAKVQLAQDLLRLGEEEEGWKLAHEVYEKDGYNVVAHNLVTLQDNITKFTTLERGGFHLRMETREAKIYGELVLDLLVRAKKSLCAKYDMQIEEPVVVEMFPSQEDFAIRTFGLPGGAGFLGVCFGRVITANSPASQTASPSNWHATLWHEFCHVVTLQKTNNKMPRWLSEGISVYEERQENSTWGQSMTPQYREMILSDDFTPVSQLSGAFLSPPSPLHLQFAYYESSLVVEYLVEKYGIEVLKRILVDLSVGMPINDALQRYAGSLAALDAEFAVYARQLAEGLAADADWAQPELPDDASLEVLAEFHQATPDNFWGLQRFAAALLGRRKWKDAQPLVERLLELYPQYPAGYSMLAAIHRGLNETDAELAVLEKLAEISADDVDAFERLLELHAEASDWAAVTRYGDRLLAINPLRPAPHRHLVRAAEELGDDDRASGSLQALVEMNPIDPADTHYRLGAALHRKGDLQAAKAEILRALEEAPRFRAAHRQLLELIAKLEQNEGSEPAPTDTPAAPALPAEETNR